VVDLLHHHDHIRYAYMTPLALLFIPYLKEVKFNLFPKMKSIKRFDNNIFFFKI